MFFQFISYFKFLLKSTNEHGVHSPFVFNFVTKGLYNKKIEIINFDEYNQLKNLSKKKKKILSKIIFYFKIDIINFENFNLENTQEKKHKLLFIKNLKSISKIKFSNLNSNHIVVINGIHLNKKSCRSWEKITKNKEITVSVNLFYLGVLFFRKEQAKEHFTIRV